MTGNEDGGWKMEDGNELSQPSAILHPPSSLPQPRKTFRKPLDDDCLLDGQLHPSIYQRLERVREVPLTAVANLIRVEKIQGVAQLVWEFVPGTPLEAIRGDAPAWSRWAREVILAVEALHSTGIVHGAIHERNVIVDPRGEIRLTHVSPLLYTDTDHDAADVIDMLDALVSRDAPDSKLAKLLAEVRGQTPTMPLSGLYARIVELDAEPPPPMPEPQRRNFSVGAILAAIAVAIAGVAIAAGVMWYVGSGDLVAGG